MNSDFLKKIEEKFYQKGRDKFGPGDTIAVHTKIEEGDKTRIQIFKGVVIAVKGSGIRQTFTVRKISYGIGVEKIFPFHSPTVERVELVKKGKNRASKLYYLRDKIGNKALQVKQGRDITEADLYVPEEGEVEVVEETTETPVETTENSDTAEVKEEKTEASETSEVKEEPKEEVKAEEKSEEPAKEEVKEEAKAEESK